MRFCSANLTDLWEREGVRTAYRRDVGDRERTKPWVVRPTPVGVDLYYDTYVGRTAARYIREYKRPEPWCCYVGFPGPHEPWTPRSVGRRLSARRHARRSGRTGVGCRPPHRRAQCAAERPTAPVWCRGCRLAGRLRRRGESHRRGHRRDLPGRARPGRVGSHDHRVHLGPRRDERRRRPLYKEVFLDGAVRVPLIIRHPGHPGANTIAEPVELLDVGATVLDFVQPESQGAFRMGRSMAGVVRGDTGLRRGQTRYPSTRVR